MIDLNERVKADNVKDLSLIPYQTAINKYLDELDKKSDLIILLTHLGVEADSLLALGLDNRIDLIIGGHTHTILHEPLVVNDIPILQTGAYLAYLGQIDLDVEHDRIINYENKLIPLKTDKLLPVTELVRFVDKIKADIDTSLGEVIGEIPYDWVPNKYEVTKVASWMTDALMKEYGEIYQVHYSMINCGGIRKQVPAGPIT